MDMDIIQRFKQFNCFKETTISEIVGVETALGNFVRKDFLNIFSVQGESSLIHYIDSTFLLVESGKIEVNVPFLLVEDLIEIGTYSTLGHLR